MPVEISTFEPPARPVWTAIARGLRNRCPNCGKGKLFRGYLKVVDACPVCSEELHHQRSDDFGPYLTMVVVGHIVVPTILAVMLATVIDPMVVVMVALPATALLALALLRPLKGGIVGLQWALRMHGFDGTTDPDAPEEPFGRPPQALRQPLPKTGLATK